MKLTVAFALIGTALLAQVRDVASFPTGTAVLTGTVVVDEPNGQPVRRALITATLTSDARSMYQTSTDDRGRFQLDSLPGASVRLVASKPGYVVTYYGAKQPGSTIALPIALANGESVEVTVRLPRGAAIAGTVTDENGEPLPSVGVRVQRVTMSALGQRVLTPTTGALIPSTDDRGAYRIFGLAAGDYVVMAQPRMVGAGEVRQATAAELQWAERQVRASGGAIAGAPGDTSTPATGQTIAYASVFYPGTVNAASAGIVSLASGQERIGIDLRMQFVPTARVEGVVTNVDGQPARGLQVMLIPESDVPNDSQRLMVLMEVGMLASTVATTAADGSFSLQGVEPGSYAVLARGGGAAGRGVVISPGVASGLWAMTDVRVDGRDITGLAMRLAPGQNVSGRILFETKTPPSTAPRVSVGLRAATTRGVGVTAPAVLIAAPNDAFMVAGLIPAAYRVGATSTGWTLKSAMLGNRDVADMPVEIKPGEDVGNLVVTLTDSPAEITGILYDGANRPTSDLSIVLFATDRAMWFSGSRRVRPAIRPASDGRFAFSGLVAGEYYLAALTDVSAADLANPLFLEQVAPAAIKVALGHGEKKTQDLRIAER